MSELAKQSPFEEALVRVAPVTPLLPLVHNCDAHTFRSILSSNQLKVSNCDTFVGDTLSYFYYGRPAYRVTKDTDSTSINSLFPVCFVVSPPDSLKLRRVFPLDSGAFSADMFKEYFHKNTAVEDLSLKPELESAGKVVSHFFGSNLNYFHSESKDVEVEAMDFEVQSYKELISSKSKTKYDDRRATIELQYGNDMNLDSSNVMMVVLPTCFMDSGKVRAKIAEWSCEVRTYHTSHWNPDEYIPLINKELCDYLMDKSFM
ncbi:hypothetical protein VINI7043_11876 [Vibrio nigripulchritudo ATCC 27043]|uniref:hypothetical protein n=1 Tax=Vibrio nigripulchritudo TaxID=28173 RepID=UPI00021C151F|nr:hypothetical protein [Vibrio nigripulchritudo]EGU55814.1 hypothetical protein VINI7043_11876 [Vibrio nigripulchritudo ATCC 27043]